MASGARSKGHDDGGVLSDRIATLFGQAVELAAAVSASPPGGGDDESAMRRSRMARRLRNTVIRPLTNLAGGTAPAADRAGKSSALEELEVLDGRLREL
ncbi:MAG TPA: hypothetical protein VLL25_07050, partial [Acidimicrobiales bacterium]|nr:hypothetical protein [Acidimicrobiales bacterium]